MSATETPIMQMLVARLDRIDERIETNRQENAREHTNITAKLETANSLRIDIAQLHSEVKTLNEKLNHGMKYLEDIKNNIMKK